MHENTKARNLNLLEAAKPKAVPQSVVDAFHDLSVTRAEAKARDERKALVPDP
jgi:hypothetical protein